MATPPTRVLSVTPVDGWTSTSRPRVSPAFDVQAGDLLVYTAFSEDSSVAITAPTWTGAEAWTLRQSIVVANYCTAYLYTCAVTATQTGVTVSATKSVSHGQFSFIVSVWRNHGGVGVSGKANTTGAPSLVLNTQANSAIVMGNSDWNAVDGSSRTWRTVNGSPITESSYGGQAGVSYTAYTGYTLDAGAAGNKTVGLTAPTGQKYSIVGIEILGSEAVTPTRFLNVDGTLVPATRQIVP